MIVETLPGIAELTPQEKWLLASELWDQVSDDPDAVPVSGSQKQEIRDRWEEYLRNPEKGSTWEEIKSRLGKG